MEWNERMKWLSTLKEGDKVYNIINRFGYNSGVKEYVVQKITPAGKIRLDDYTLLDKNGEKYEDYGSGSITIWPMCDKVQKVINEIKTKNLLHECKDKIEKLKFENLNYETLGNIKELINSMAK